MPQLVPFPDLSGADLLLDAIYEGGPNKNISADPLSQLLPGGNSGGFRYRGQIKPGGLPFVALYSTLSDVNWPDSLDLGTGVFTYYGDNKTAGVGLHDTSKGGNEILRLSFDGLHGQSKEARLLVPPFFIFTSTGSGRDIIFRGLAVPGAINLSAPEDLVAVWHSTDGCRFQNYRAYFTILDVPIVPRAWIEDLLAGQRLSQNCPPAMRAWIEHGKYTPLRAAPTVKHRTKEEQLPSDSEGNKVLKTIHAFFQGNPHGFEHCSAKLVRMMDGRISNCDVTRPSRDGGRDAIGEYRIGFQSNSIRVTFALEAKCYSLDNSVGVRETSRLISRLLHRQFGVFMTTSYLGEQAYKEIIADNHPVVILSGVDIVTILREAGFKTANEVQAWLTSEFSTFS